MKDYFNDGNQGLGALGQLGLRVLTGNAIAGETFVAIQVLEDAVISCDLLPYTTPKGNEIGDTSITSLSLTAGTVIYGRFVDLEVASGKVIAYQG